MSGSLNNPNTYPVLNVGGKGRIVTFAVNGGTAPFVFNAGSWSLLSGFHDFVPEAAYVDNSQSANALTISIAPFGMNFTIGANSAEYIVFPQVKNSIFTFNGSTNFSVYLQNWPFAFNQSGSVNLSGQFAALNGAAQEVFNVANATTSTEAVPLGQAESLFQPTGNYAALNGSSSEVFNVANATTSTEAVALGQAQADFAAINGSSSEVFNVANATTSTEAVAQGQVLNVAPVGANNYVGGSTTVSVTTSTFTAPCNGNLVILINGQTTATYNSPAASATSTLAGIVELQGSTAGCASYYLSMKSGQSTSITATYYNANSGSIWVGATCFFLPTP